MSHDVYETGRTPGWNFSTALANAGGDPELLSEVLAIFAEDCPHHLHALRIAVARADAAEVARIAHILKGQLLTLGAEAAGSCADELERLGRGGTLNGAAGLLVPLESAAGELLETVPARNADSGGPGESARAR